MTLYPINPETVKMRALLPAHLAKLSRVNEEAALELLRAWGEGTKSVKLIYSEVVEELNKRE